MPEIRVPYGKTFLSAALPDIYNLISLAPPPVAPASDPAAAVIAALDSPAGGIRLDDFSRARTAAIAINDKTRPVPHEYLLPPLLDRLAALGISANAITLIIANGLHPPMQPGEFSMILPDAISAAHPVVSHDAEDDSSLVEVGRTERDTPVWMNRHFMEADLRIVVGNIEPHQFMGYSGGVKSAAIGLAGAKTINHNHALMTHPDALLGHYDHNPARGDVEEIGRLIRVDFAVNALLNDRKQIVDVIAGEPRAVMRAAIPRVGEIFQVDVTAPFDLLIASPGGHPKDINLYQAQKGLAHAALVTREGGTIILVAACGEGTGSGHYEDWMLSLQTPSYDAVFERFAREGFRVGPHKAFQIARDASRIKVILVSEMAADFVRRLLLHPAENLNAALEIATENLPDGAQVGVMPVANATIPRLM